MAHGFSAVCAHNVYEQFFRWTLAASVDPSVTETQRDALYRTLDNKMNSSSSDACADKMPMCSIRLGLRDFYHVIVDEGATITHRNRERKI